MPGFSDTLQLHKPDLWKVLRSQRHAANDRVIVLLYLTFMFRGMNQNECSIYAPALPFFASRLIQNTLSQCNRTDYQWTLDIGNTIKFMYHLNICSHTIHKCNKHTAASSEELHIPTGTTCRVLGRLPAREWSELSLPVTENNPEGKGVSIAYKNGDKCNPIQNSNRETVVNIACSKTAGAGRILDMNKVGPCKIIFKMESEHACPTRHGLSNGSVFLILFTIVVFSYCVGGALINYKLNGIHEKLEIPNREFWCVLPKYAMSGCEISFRKTKEFIQSKMNKRQDSGRQDSGSDYL